MRTVTIVLAALAVGLTTVGCAVSPGAPPAPSPSASADLMDEGEMAEPTTDPTAACRAVLTAAELTSLTGIAGFVFVPETSDVDRAGVRLCAFDTPDPGAGVDTYVATYAGPAYRGEFTVGRHTFVGLPDVVPVPGLGGPAHWQASTNRLFVDLADHGLQVYFAAANQTPDRNLADATAIAKLVAIR